MIKILTILLLTAMPAEKTWNTKDATVNRIYDEETGVACYIIPAYNCFTKCFYSPAISCVKIK